MISLLFTALFLLVPVALLWLTHHQDWARKVGIIVLCYIAGLALGNAGLIPEPVKPLQRDISAISVALAMPLLLFTLDIRQWRQVAGKAMLSMIFATTAVVAVATSLFFAFKDQGAESASHFAAMSVAVYTGGTPNLAAIKAGLDIPDSEYIVFHSLDTFVGAAYLLIMLTLGIPFFRKLLPHFPRLAQSPPQAPHHFDSDDYTALLERHNFAEIIKATLLSVVVVAVALGVSQLNALVFSVDNSSALVIVALTTLGILLSLIPQVRAMHLSYKLGMYLIYVFCFVVASMASLDQLAAVDLTVVAFLFGTVGASLLLHGLLCKLAGIDSDTFMVTSVAAVCSPPFVPMMARALDNPATILSGMTTGIIGYALGNYLGISLALLLQNM